MKTVEEFQSFYESDLTETLKKLELDRKGVIKYVWLVVLGLLVLICSVIGFVSNIYLIAFPILIVSSIVLIIILEIKKNKRKWAVKTKYKEEVIRKIIHFLSTDLNYSPAGFISQEEFSRSKIFVQTPNRYKGDDLVEGKIGHTSVRFSELHAEYYTTNSKGQRSYHTIFRGIFFIADFNKKFAGETMVLEDTAERLFGKLGTMFQKMNVSRPKLVKLEDPTFEKEFAVYGTDQVESRYILTPAMMSRIVDFKQKSGKVSLSFLHSNVYIALNVSKNLFEAPIYRTMLNFDRAKEYFNYLVLCVEIVEDLDLNTRIWTKD